MGTFNVTANSETSVTATGSWNMTFQEIEFRGGTECTNTYLRIHYKLSTNSSWTTFATGSSGTDTDTVSVSHTNSSMLHNKTYNFKLTQFYTLVGGGPGGEF